MTITAKRASLCVNNLLYPNPVTKVFIEAATACGYSHNLDFNGASQAGVGYYQVTQNKGKRHSSADAFLDPVSSRHNLKVLTNTRVLKLLVGGGIAQVLAPSRVEPYSG